jgi:hypothetical protein
MENYNDWINKTQCDNILVNRNLNRAVYPTAFIGITLIEEEYIPTNPFMLCKYNTVVDGLVVANNKANADLANEFNGVLVEAPYSDNLYMFKFESTKGLENAYNFLIKNYNNILSSFNDTL